MKQDKRTSAASRGYGSRWQRARTAFLTRNSMCIFCLALGRRTPATVVDHRIPHRGDPKLFWDVKNWQPCCKRCHDSTKQKQEKTGVLVGTSLDGRPVDPNHPWNLSGK